MALDNHLRHSAAFDVIDELGVLDVRLRGATIAELIKDGHHHQSDDEPNGDVLGNVVQESGPFAIKRFEDSKSILPKPCSSFCQTGEAAPALAGILRRCAHATLLVFGRAPG